MNRLTPEQLAAEIQRRANQLHQLNLDLRRQLELAELLLPRLNIMLDQLQAVGLADKLMFSAGMIMQHPYEQGRGHVDSIQTFHAVLKIPGGVGALILDSEETFQIEQANPGNPWWPPSRFMPLSECPDAVKAMLVQKVPELLSRLLNSLAIGDS